MTPSEPRTPIQSCLDRLAVGDTTARDDLLRAAAGRLLVLVRSMLARYPSLRRWEQSEDILQNVLLRLDRALRQLSFPTTRDFLAVSAVNVRRELIDLARHHFGPEGIAKNHVTPLSDSGHAGPDRFAGPQAEDPSALAEWTELHETIATLPAEDREMFDLHWYLGLSLQETADAIGVSLRTAKRRWVSAKLRLTVAFGREAVTDNA
jgi:RNA polymerase sigma factor (sigma-70 family)